MKTRLSLLLPLLTLAIAGAAPTVDEIVRKAYEVSYFAGKDGRAEVEMKINDARGGTRVKRFVILRLNGEGEAQKFYVYFKAPADVRGMAYLVWKHGGERDDDRWLWLSDLNLKKRIAPGDKRTSFVGSDFLYEDVSGRSIREDNHELVETTEELYKVRNTPKQPESVEFAHYFVWIDRKTFLPRKAEYYDRKGKLYRTVEATKVETIQGHPTVIESVAADLVAGTKTTNTFSKVKYDIGLKDRIFAERFLRRPPREVR